MNEAKKARIINECLDAVIQNHLSVENCLERYPEIRADILDVFIGYRIVQQYSEMQIPAQQKSILKNQLMFKLVDRDEIVTKPPLLRYRWQNIKRRFSMSWIIIVTTFLSLISGAGVVYASNTALPGEMLYPVKTWVEDAQLSLSPDPVDMKLLEKFADHRIEEMAALIEVGEFDRFGRLIEGYQNQQNLMTALMLRIEVENPDEAIRLRTELKNQLQDHARIIEGYLKIDEENDPIQERLRLMLQTNTRTQLRINQESISVDPIEPVNPSEGSLEPAETTEVLPESETKFQNQNENRVIDRADVYLQDGALKFQFRFERALEGDVYAEVNGKYYGCIVEGVLATCDLTGVPGTGKLNLIQKDSSNLLYSYDYDHDYSFLWEGTKESGTSQPQGKGNPENGNGSSGSGQNGMN